MNIYHYASDGSLIAKLEAGYCQQYSDGVSSFFAYVDGVDPDDYVATISLTPAGASSSITLTLPKATRTVDGAERVGYERFLPSTVTQIAGAMAFNLYITSKTGTVLVTQTGSIYVNPSSGGAEWDTPINEAQWQEIVNYIIGLNAVNLGTITDLSIFDDYKTESKQGSYYFIYNGNMCYLTVIADDSTGTASQSFLYINSNLLTIDKRSYASSIWSLWQRIDNNNEIVSIEQTSTSMQSGGLNIITITLSDGTEHTFNVYNGQQGIVSGGPSGAYATLTDLETAYPTGNEHVYVIAADGNWYYWNTSTSAWAAGGIYQSSLTTPQLNSREPRTQNTYTIYGWYVGLGPHFHSAWLGHLASYAGYTSTEYLHIQAGDVANITIGGEVNTSVTILKYSVLPNGKVNAYIESTVYSSTTSVIFDGEYLIKICCCGSSNPSPLSCQSAVTLTTYQSAEELFVYPYGKWNICGEYATTASTVKTVNNALNGDPYYMTWRGASQSSADSIGPVVSDYCIYSNMNYMFLKYNAILPSPSTIRWSNNSVLMIKYIGFVNGVMKFAIPFTNMNDSNQMEIASSSSQYPNTVYQNTSAPYLVLRSVNSNDNYSDILSMSKSSLDDAFDSVIISQGWQYSGKAVDLSLRTNQNNVLSTWVGHFPFVSTQHGGQKPSSMAHYGNLIFVGCDAYGCNIINLDDFSFVTTINDSSLDHWNNSAFTDVFYDIADSYPLMLVGNGNHANNQDLGDNYSDYIKQIRFSNDLTSFSSVGQYILPRALSGYYSNCLCLDKSTKTMWIIGYNLSSWQTEANNYCIVTSWDLTNTTTDEHGNLIPAIKNRFIIPFIRGTQDATFVNGYMIFWSAPNSTGQKVLHVINTINQTIQDVDCNNFSRWGEIETIDNVYDPVGDCYYLLAGEALFANFGGVSGSYGNIYKIIFPS